MASRARLGLVAADTTARVIAELLRGGWLRLYSGVRPSDPDEPARPDLGQVLLAQLKFGDPAFSLPSRGTIVGAPFAEIEGAAPSTGRATWFRASTALGVTVLDGTVGRADAALILDDPHIPMGAEVVIERFSYQVQEL